MNSRERARMALNHQEPDRVPLDLGSTYVSTIQMPAYQRLLKHLGMEEEPKILQFTGNTADVSEQVRRRFGLDFIGIHLPGKPYRGTRLPQKGNFMDEWGIEWKKSNDASGIYYPYAHPLSDGFEEDEVEEAVLVPDYRDPSRVAGLREITRKLYEETDYAIVGDLLFTVTQRGADLMGMENYFCDLMLEESKIARMLEKICVANLDAIRLFLKEVGEYLDVVTLADDLGTQFSPMFSPDKYRRLIKPLHKVMIDEIRKYTKAKIMMHNDGAIKVFIPDIIEVGFDILNPLQTSATGMNAADIKSEFGKDLTFWGGIDSQYVMAQGDAQAVEREVREKMEILAPGGGYVCGNIHNITYEIVPENIVALFDTARACGVYGSKEG